jgi:hypothetical protein
MNNLNSGAFGFGEPKAPSSVQSIDDESVRTMKSITDMNNPEQAFTYYTKEEVITRLRNGVLAGLSAQKAEGILNELIKNGSFPTPAIKGTEPAWLAYEVGLVNAMLQTKGLSVERLTVVKELEAMRPNIQKRAL